MVGLDQKLETRRREMSREQSDGEDSVVETEDGPVDDGTAETEVNLRLPRGSDPGPELVRKDIPIVPGAVGAEADPPDPGQTRRLGPLCGAKPKRCTYDPPTQRTPGPGGSLPGTGTQPGTNWFAYELPTLPTSGYGRPPKQTRTQPVPDRFMDDPLNMPTRCMGLIGGHHRRSCVTWIGHQRPI